MCISSFTNKDCYCEKSPVRLESTIVMSKDVELLHKMLTTYLTMIIYEKKHQQMTTNYDL